MDTYLTYLVDTLKTILPDTTITITQRKHTSSPIIIIENREILVVNSHPPGYTALICQPNHTTIGCDDYNNHDTVVKKLKFFLNQLKFEQI